MKYQGPFRDDLPAADVSLTNNPTDAAYVNGDPAVAREGSIPPAASFEQHQRELVHLISYSTQTPSNLDLEQVRKAIKWMIDQQATLASVGGGVPVYEGLESAVQKIRSLIAGTNITIEVVEDGSTGDFALKLNSTAGTGGSTVTIGNSGSGVAVYKGNEAGVERFRTLEGAGGITIALSGDGTKVVLTGSSGGGGNILNAGDGVEIGKETSGVVTALRSLKAGIGVALTLIDGDGDEDEIVISGTPIIPLYPNPGCYTMVPAFSDLTSNIGQIKNATGSGGWLVTAVITLPFGVWQCTGAWGVINGSGGASSGDSVSYVAQFLRVS